MEMPLKKSPVITFVITQDEITRKGYRHLTDILKNTPEIHTANLSSSEGAVTEIYVRGVYANNKFTALVDGIKIKSPAGEPISFLDSMPLLEDGGDSLTCLPKETRKQYLTSDLGMVVLSHVSK